MIIYYSQGGLGNQLFQYAFARQLAINYQTSLYLDPSWFLNMNKKETPRHLDILSFNVKPMILGQKRRMISSLLRRRAVILFSPILPIKPVRERPGQAPSNVLRRVNNNSFLFGYWQSQDYFSLIRSQLLNEFTPQDRCGSSFDHLSVEMQSTNSVSLHIRRGDYVNSPFHSVCDLSYYLKALNVIMSKVNEVRIYVFSDDVEWCRRYLSLPAPFVLIRDLVELSSPLEMYLMSKCRHHVIANSTFSWWGAWLSTYSNKIVVAPAEWFANSPRPPYLIPSEWQLI
jgi:hypothetical protein